MAEAQTLRVLLVDDQALVRAGFRLVLELEEDIEVIGEAADGGQALRLLAERPADVVLMDIQMPGVNGIEATREVTRRQLGRVLMLTTFGEDQHLMAALRAGASGFLLKTATPEELVAAVRAVGSGQALLSPEVTLPLIRRVAGMPGESREGAPEHGLAGEGRTGKAAGGCASSPDAVEPGAGAEPDPAREAEREEARRRLATLTPRETQILGLMAQGLSNGEIAEKLWLGQATVKTHVSAVFAKTGSRDRVQAVVLAHRAGLGARD
ncbi:response regulator transcription factor [Rothia kristinae]|uniref:response regulator transcription factor n=1 Tax=Rothia kristinae TaxID=37923 RepID=UPI0009299807|nr:response regulator transcription factor [Rothia kristinae]TDP56905.1 LuxR family two component transcriptional regulator [Kocuria sp. AG109]WGH10216.1 response regulator transcription factor [Rothia kristinae]SIM93547.1 two component LuxR family transcriptional regulator [Mycobacteroides abscessus subsp. abscessus]